MAEPAKYFSNVILSQYVMTGIPVDVHVDGGYLRLTDVEDVEDPYYGFGMDADGGMHEFDYRMIDHILVNGNNITLDTYNKAMGTASKEEKPEGEEEKPEGEEEPKKEESVMKLKSLIEKSVSKQQQKLFGTALSVKRGETPANKVSKDVKTLAKSMPEKELEKFAATKHKDLPKKVNEDLENDKKKLQKLKQEKAKQAKEIATLTLKIADQEADAAQSGVTEGSDPVTSVSEPYTIQIGDLVQNINTACPHYGSMGIVQKLISLPDDMGTLVKYTVTNDGDTYSAGDSLIKTVDQLSLADVEDEIDMNDYTDEYDEYDVVDYDFGDEDDYEYYEDEEDEELDDEDND